MTTPTTRFRVSAAVREYYPEYWSRGIQSYPAVQCAPFSRVARKWGIFSNFAPTPLEVDGIAYKNSEQLFQCQKFTVSQKERRHLGRQTYRGVLCRPEPSRPTPDGAPRQSDVKRPTSNVKRKTHDRQLNSRSRGDI